MPEPAPDPELVDDIQFAEPEPVHEPEPEPVYEPIPEPEPEIAPALATGVAPQPEPVDEAADIDVEEPAMSADQSPILSRDAETAASAAFGALASSLSSSNGGRTLEDIVGDMLRPMLKEWLDDNLPALVERLVAEEIERVSRRRG
jgi:cell pole-organizing protein PopZ